LIGEKTVIESPSACVSFLLVANNSGSGCVTKRSSAASNGSAEGAPFGAADEGVGELPVVDEETVSAGGGEGSVEREAMCFPSDNE
jgi:hypothetical protein